MLGKNMYDFLIIFLYRWNDEKACYPETFMDGVFISAENKEQALKWGRTVGVEYVSELASVDGISLTLEDSLLGITKPEKLENKWLSVLPRVRAGEMPDIPAWIRRRKTQVELATPQEYETVFNFYKRWPIHGEI
jgi:hypothetical protein